MANYIVIVDHIEDIATIVERLNSEYTDKFYAHSRVKQMFYVRTDDITPNIAVKLGMITQEKEKAIRGSVYNITSSYYGFSDTGIWQWLGKSDE